MTDDRSFAIRPADAARAMRALLKNPEDTAQVFRIIDALSGKNGERSIERMRRSQSGRRLLDRRPKLLDRLLDREAMMQLPEGSLGRRYVEFLDAEGITAEGLRQASIDGRALDGAVSPDLDFFRDRMRDTHDLWHVVTGYSGDLVGEASLLAFTFAQTRNPGVGFIVAIALLRGREPAVRKMILRGFLRGARARWLPAVDWEKLLALPLDTVRRTLRVGAPPDYERIYSDDPRAMAA